MILLFAGAGASYAINKEKYPTTEEFWKLLSDEIKNSLNNALHGKINEAMSEIFSDDKLDIEKVLGVIYEFINQLSPGIDQSMISTPFISTYIPGKTEKEKYLSELSKIESSIYRKMHYTYIQEPTEKDIEIWDFLIKNLLDKVEIELFTTNYDTVLEKVIYKNGDRFSYKTDDGTGSILDLSVFGSTKKENRFIKLHGSMDWYFKNKRGKIGIGFDDYIEDRNKRAILYPGDKIGSKKGNEVFREMLDHLRISCQSCSLAVFIGFSFMDDHINQMLKYIPENVKKIIINYPPNMAQIMHDDFPFDEFVYKGGGFNRNSAQGILEVL